MTAAARAAAQRISGHPLIAAAVLIAAVFVTHWWLTAADYRPLVCTVTTSTPGHTNTAQCGQLTNTIEPLQAGRTYTLWVTGHHAGPLSQPTVHRVQTWWLTPGVTP